MEEAEIESEEIKEDTVTKLKEGSVRFDNKDCGENIYENDLEKRDRRVTRPMTDVERRVLE